LSPKAAVAVGAVSLLVVLGTAAGQPALRPEATDAGLLFTEMVLKPGETSSRTLRLVRATFRNGNLSDRQELYTGDASESGMSRNIV
jgi:hypothetical protein